MSKHTEPNYVDFNLNSNIKVKLNNYGRSILKKQHNELYSSLRVIDVPYIPHPVDEEGYCTFQMYVFMNTFGSHVLAGSVYLPFSIDIKVSI